MQDKDNKLARARIRVVRRISCSLLFSIVDNTRWADKRRVKKHSIEYRFFVLFPFVLFSKHGIKACVCGGKKKERNFVRVFM